MLRFLDKTSSTEVKTIKADWMSGEMGFTLVEEVLSER